MIALVFVVLALVPPAIFLVRRSVDTPQPLDVALPLDATAARYPFHAGPNGLGYVFELETSKTAADETLVGCLMRFEDPPYAAVSPLCKEVRDRVAFRWTLESAGATVATGRYGAGNFSPTVNPDAAVGRFASQKPMPRGDYVLAIADLHVPHQLVDGHPRLFVRKRVDEFDMSPALWLVGGTLWSIAFFVAAIVAAIVSLRSGPAGR